MNTIKIGKFIFMIFIIILFSHRITNNNFYKNFKEMFTLKISKKVHGRVMIKKINLIHKDIIGIVEDEENDNLLFFNILDIGCNKSGELFIVDTGNHRVQKFDINSNYLQTIGTKGKGPGEFIQPVSIAFDKYNNIFVLDSENRLIQIFDPQGKFIESVNIMTISTPNQLKIDCQDNIYITGWDWNDRYRIYKYNKKGKLFAFGKPPEEEKDIILEAMLNSGDLAIDSKDQIYFMYTRFFKIEKFDHTGKLLFSFNRKLPFKPPDPRKYLRKEQNITMGITSEPICNAIYIDENDLIYILHGNSKDIKLNFIDIFNTNGEFLYTFNLPINCYDFTIDEKNEILYLVESEGTKVYKYLIDFK